VGSVGDPPGESAPGGGRSAPPGEVEWTTPDVPDDPEIARQTPASYAVNNARPAV